MDGGDHPLNMIARYKVGGTLNFELTDEQRLLQEAVANFLQRHYTFEARARAIANGGFRSEIWDAFAQDLGILGALLPGDLGGLDGGPVEAMVILREFGRALVLEPYLETVVLAGALLRLGGGDAARALAQASIDGRARVVPVLGEVRVVRDGEGWRLDGDGAVVAGGPSATHFLISAHDAAGENAGVSLFAIDRDAAGLGRADHDLIDARRASTLRLDSVFAASDAVIGEPGAAGPIVERAVDEAIAALCAEATGVMQAMLDQTVAYSRQREQFGKPIGTFQVLQHRMVDMFVCVEKAQSLSYMAALSLDQDRGTRRRAVSAAKAMIAQSARTVAQSAIQIHGGIGTTDELAISHYFKRATVIAGQLGSATDHLRAYMDAVDPGG